MWPCVAGRGHRWSVAVRSITSRHPRSPALAAASSRPRQHQVTASHVITSRPTHHSMLMSRNAHSLSKKKSPTSFTKQVRNTNNTQKHPDKCCLRSVATVVDGHLVHPPFVSLSTNIHKCARAGFSLYYNVTQHKNVMGHCSVPRQGAAPPRTGSWLQTQKRGDGRGCASTKPAGLPH